MKFKKTFPLKPKKILLFGQALCDNGGPTVFFTPLCPHEVFMQNRRPISTLSQQIQGIFIFHEGVEDVRTRAIALMKTLNCTVVDDNTTRVLIKTSRSNLQSIKKCWLSKSASSTMSVDLNDCFSKILIGGRA